MRAVVVIVFLPLINGQIFSTWRYAKYPSQPLLNCTDSIYGFSYGNGIYQVSGSPQSIHPSYNLFDDSSDTSWTSPATYTTSKYAGTTTTMLTNGTQLFGEYIQIELPSPILARTFNTTMALGNSYYPRYMSLLGATSANTTAWTFLITVSKQTWNSAVYDTLNAAITLNALNYFSVYRVVYTGGFSTSLPGLYGTKAYSISVSNIFLFGTNGLILSYIKFTHCFRYIFKAD
jgi:hypothetical protein